MAVLALRKLYLDPLSNVDMETVSAEHELDA